MPQANRARQLLILRSLLTKASADAMHEALDRQCDVDGLSPAGRGRLLQLVVELPSLTLAQADEVLGELSVRYRGELEQIVVHFRRLAMASPVSEWLRVFDRSVEVAVMAVADLVDSRSICQPLVDERVVDLAAQAKQLIDDIEAEESLDETTRQQLLASAHHLQYLLRRLNLFGTEGVRTFEGDFLTWLINERPDLIPRTDQKDVTAEQSFSRRLWGIMAAAAVVTGLTSDAIALGHVVLELTK